MVFLPPETKNKNKETQLGTTVFSNLFLKHYLSCGTVVCACEHGCAFKCVCSVCVCVCVRCTHALVCIVNFQVVECIIFFGLGG
uniref:Uncharacterized protein n=1 Tax=Anguilla anguilla TaxID=7936 RepID=A0A0E9WMT9_ANGAN